MRGKDYALAPVLYGGNNGLTANGDEMITEATKGVPGNPADLNYIGQHAWRRATSTRPAMTTSPPPPVPSGRRAAVRGQSSSSTAATAG